MSQVRGRIKTVVNYDDRLTVIGTCCENDGTKTTKTLSQCSQDGGRWVPVENPDDVTCPALSDRGCCCACAYTTKNTGTSEDWTHPDHAEAILGGRKGSSNGLKDNVTKCECEYYEGNWNDGVCPENPQEILSQCATEGVEGRDDVRWPFACCHCEYDANNEVYRECANVCLSRDCAALGEGFEGTGFNCTPEFDRFEICDYETSFGGLPKECPEVTEAVPGCTNPECGDAYDPEATEDDGSCPEPCGPPPPPPEETGACCVGNACNDGITPSVCSSAGGEYQGQDSTCLSNPCDDSNGGGGPPPPPNLGACCQGSFCSQTTLSNCNGDFKGVGVPCTNPNPCTAGQLGACCIGDQCSETTEDLCSGSFQGAGSSCDDGPCGGGGGPPPPTVECEPNAGVYDIPVDVSSLGWDVNTVYRPRNDAGEIDSEDGPTVYQQAYMRQSTTGWRGCDGCQPECRGSDSCDGYCSGRGYCYTGGTSVSGSSFNLTTGFRRESSEKTLDKTASEECVRICDQGPDLDDPNSQQSKDWGFATKKLGPPLGGWKKWGIRYLTESSVGTDPDGQPAMKWNCDGYINHPYEECTDERRVHIDAPYISPLDGRSSDSEYPEGGPPGVEWVPTPPYHDADGGYYDLRPIDGPGGIKELWNARYADVGFDWDYAIDNGLLRPLEDTFEDDPDNYNENGWPVPGQGSGSALYISELQRQWDFYPINANLDSFPDGYNVFGNEVDFWGQALNGANPCDVSGDGGDAVDEVEQLCERNKRWFRRWLGARKTRLTTFDPLVNGIETPIEPKTQRCYDVCMEPDTPLHLKKYIKPSARFADWYLDIDWPSNPNTCPWDVPELTIDAGSAYARTYEDAVLQCETIYDTLPGTWKPDSVDDFWVEIMNHYTPGWRYWVPGWCPWDDDWLEDIGCSLGNLTCWYYNWRNIWDYGITTRTIVVPTASIFGKKIPGGESAWIGSNETLGSSYPSSAWGWVDYGFWAYPKDPPYDPDRYNWDVEANPLEFWGDGQYAPNGLVTWYNSLPNGSNAWKLENWKIGPGENWNTGVRSNYHERGGICLNTESNFYRGFRSGEYGTVKGCSNYWRCCRYTICSTSGDCDSGLLPQERGEGPRQPDQPKTPLFYANPSDAGIIIENSTDASACCTLDKNGVFKCEYKSRKDCEMQNGFYNVPDDDGPITCSSTLCQKAPEIKKSGFVIPPKIKSSDLPEPGTIFAGGVFIGTFTPGVSQVLSNVETGSSTRIKTSTKRGPGDDKRKWALILSPNDLGMEFGLDSMMYRYLSPSETVPKNQTSLYDGLFNTYGNDKNARKPKTNLLNQIRNYNLFSFRDWYLPSIEELGFVGVQQKDLDFGVNLNRYSQNQAKLQSNVPYMSSSRKMTKKVKLGRKDFSKYPAANFIYSVLLGNALGPMNGFTVLSGLDNTFRVRLVRRIYVED